MEKNWRSKKLKELTPVEKNEAGKEFAKAISKGLLNSESLDDLSSFIKDIQKKKASLKMIFTG